MGRKGVSYKREYDITEDLYKAITAEETVEQIEEYYAHIKACIEENICSECGQPVKLSSYRDKWVKREYGISGLCHECQIKTFG